MISTASMGVRLDEPDIVDEAWRDAARTRARGARSRIFAFSTSLLVAAGLDPSPHSLLIVGAIFLAVVIVQLTEARFASQQLLSRKPKSDAARFISICFVTMSGLLSAVLLIHFWRIGTVPAYYAAAAVLIWTTVKALATLHHVRPYFFGLAGPTFLVVVVLATIPLWGGDVGEFANWAPLISTAFLLGLVWRALQQMNSTATSLRRANLRRRLEVRRAAEANLAKSDFLAIMSHELRTPMNAVMGSVEVLRRSDLDLKQREQLEAVIDGGAVLMELLNDLLDMSKIEAGRLETEQIPVNVRRLAAGLERMWRPRAEDKGLCLKVWVDPRLPECLETDPTRLRQILFNLLSNAVKFTEEGEVRMRVGVDRQAKAGEPVVLRIDVSDTGCGMSKATQARVFEPFLQADASIARRFGGSGLGLSISMGLTKAIGAELSVDSAPGAGSVFTLTVPTRAQASSDDVADVELPNSLHILVADDNPANRRVLGALIQPLSATVIMAKDGEEAVELFKLGAFDLILMDVKMPNMDGLEATRHIRASGPRGAAAPIIALTANADAKSRDACLEAGMTQFVPKPIDPRQLHTAIAAALEARPGATEAA